MPVHILVGEHSIANLIQTYIAFQGYYKNKKAGEEQKIETK